jgi:spore coat polysaccharide biosynthesis protein SpsF (cytidylyltransferase family)
MNDPEREWIKKTALNYGAGRVCVPDVHYDDVLQGFVRAIDCVENTLQEEVSWVVRITSDCWNIDPYIIDSVLGFCEQTGIPMTQQFFEASTVQCYRKVDYQRGDRELTGDIRNDACEGFRKGFEKGSIDNREDLEKARRIYENAI